MKRSGKVVRTSQGDVMVTSNTNKQKGETAVSPGLSNFVLHMYNHLTREQRYAVYLGLQRKDSRSAIARQIGVSPSTVSREISRNATKSGKYVWNRADDLAASRARRTPGNRRIPETLRWRVEQLIMDEQWSPRQISGWLRREEGVSISHETIYRMVRSEGSGRLARNCRHGMRYRRRKSAPRETRATNIRNRRSIHERPVEADGRRFGDWEMDLIVDSNSNAILTMIERSTNFLLMARLREGRRSMPLAKTVWRLLLPYKGDNLKTITTDNGSEFAAHEWITRKLGVPVFFTDAYSSWQKGAVENTNKLIRQYIPKGTDIGRVTDKRIASIQAKINRRPREKLNFSTPKEEFFKLYT